MLIGGIDFPDGLIDNIRTGNLVIFAGAGVSFGPPSNLPLYTELARRLSQGSGLELVEGVPIERFIGDLEKKTDVKQKTIDIIRRSAGHNTLHEHLIGLFGSVDQVKVVTTNYDQHFESASKVLFGAVPECYHSPALPLGTSFYGIVHVHGSLRDKSGIVLTDADFGRAYLTEGWARRFLVDLFYTHNVLFVGYRHEDTVMTYLARALPVSQEARRYALEIGQDAQDKWSALGVTKIPFGTGAPGDFDIQSKALKGLSEHINRSLLDWGSRIGRSVKGDPPTDLAESSQLLHALKDPHVCRIFTQHSIAAVWLEWLHANSRLNFLFDKGAWGECESILSGWIVFQVLRDDVTRILRLVAQHKKMHERFWEDLCRGVRHVKSPCDRNALAMLLGILVDRSPLGAPDFCISSIGDASKAHDLPWVSLTVFKKLCSGVLLVEMNTYQIEENDSVIVSIKPDSIGKDHAITEVYKHVYASGEVFDRHVVDFLSSICLDRHLCHARWSVVDEYTFDSDSYSRSAVEPHEQDRFRRDFSAIVDALRDSCARYARSHGDIGRLWCLESLSAAPAIIRRVALHTACVIEWPDINLLIDGVITHSLDDTHARHEVFYLLRKFYGRLIASMRQRLISGISAVCKFNRDPSGDPSYAHAALQWFHWIGEGCPECLLLQSELSFIRELYPNMRCREHPDLTYYSSSRWGGDPSPYSAKQLLAMDPYTVVGLPQSPALQGIDSGNVWDQVALAARSVQWAQAVLAVLRREGSVTGVVGAAVVKGICRQLETEDTFAAGVALLQSEDIAQSHAEIVASALYNVVKDNPKDHVKAKIDALDVVALTVWLGLTGEVTSGSNSVNQVMRSINSSAGTIAEYYVNALSLRCNMNKNGPKTGIPESYKSMFAEMLGDKSRRGDLARPVVISQCRFISYLDRKFARDHVIPLFSDPDTERAMQAWHGFITWGQLDHSLAEDMRSGFEYANAHLLGRMDDLLERYVHYMHTEAVMLDPSPALSWSLLWELQSSEPAREAVGRSTFSIIDDAPPNVIAEQWNGWISQYWNSRFSGDPVPLSDKEVEIYLDHLVELGEAFPLAVELLRTARPCAIEHTSLFMYVLERELHFNYVKATRELIRFVFSCKKPSWVLYKVDEILRQLIPLLGSHEEKLTLVNEAIREQVLSAEEALVLTAPRPQ